MFIIPGTVILKNVFTLLWVSQYVQRAVLYWLAQSRGRQAYNSRVGMLDGDFFRLLLLGGANEATSQKE